MSRRRVLLWTGAAAGAGAGLVVALPRREPSDQRRAAPAPAPTTTSATSTSTTPRTRELEIFVYGTAASLTLSWTVNGTTTTAIDTVLPWRHVERVPVGTNSTTWRLDYRLSRGEIDYSVLLDGFPRTTGYASAEGEGVATPSQEINGTV